MSDNYTPDSVDPVTFQKRETPHHNFNAYVDDITIQTGETEIMTELDVRADPHRTLFIKTTTDCDVYIQLSDDDGADPIWYDLVGEIPGDINSIVPLGYKEAWIEFLVTNVGETMVATQLTPANVGVPAFSKVIYKDIEIMFEGTVMPGAYLKLNTVATDVPATKLGGRYYGTLSALHFDGKLNGQINAELTEAAYLQLSAGVGSLQQTVECTLHIYYI